ncbi:MAG: class I adenylate-forming enzyme family protein [Acidimicrobiales bacterium]
MTTFSGPPAGSEEGIGALTMGGLLEEVVAQHREREALCLARREETSVRWTYATLGAQSRLLARALLSAGVEKGTRVALLMGNRPEWVQCAFAVAMTGGVLVPVNTLFEPPEIAHVLGHSEAAFVLHQASLGHHAYDEQLAGLDGLPCLRHRLCIGTPQYEELLESADDVSEDTLTARADGVSPDDDAVVIYTSGSTGRPKGVLHAQRAGAIQSWRFARHLRLDPNAKVWSAFPFFWTAGFCMVMGATLAAGGCLVLEELFEPGEALSFMEREKVDTAYAWPHQMGALEAHPSWLEHDLSSIRHVEEFSALARHPTVDVSDAWSPRSAYGLTETFTIISSVPSDTPAEEREGHEGLILPGNAIRIVDASTGEALPVGVAGEIRVKGPTLMKGYLKVEPEAVFDEDGFFATGDAGFVDDRGRLHWAGRTTDLIKTGGANVSPVEIETELLHHPDLASSLAVGVPHPTLGQVVVVCAVARHGANVTQEDVRKFLKGKIASYKIPRHVLFFEKDDLVLTGNAKIKSDELRALAEARLRSGLVASDPC